MRYKLGNKSKRELVGVNPILAFAVVKAIEITEQDFTVFDGLRTLNEQRKLVNRGYSKTMNSKHLSGNAADLVAWVDGKPSWDEKYYPAIEIAMKTVIKQYNLPIEWGYDKWGWDMPHWQVTKQYRKLYDIRKFAFDIVKG